VRWLEKFFGRLRPPFENDGRLSVFKPLFEALENFCFAPGHATVVAPHVRDAIDVKRFMSMVIVALLPCLAAAYYFFGLRLLAMIAVSYAAGGAVEVAVALIRKEDIAEGFLVTGMIFPMLLPPTLPLWMVAVGVAFGVFVGKEMFGGTGRNIFNPAIVGRCFLALAYPAAMAGNWVSPGAGLTGRTLQYVSSANAEQLDAISSATPLALAKQGECAALLDMFLGHTSGSLGETSILCIILGGVFLLWTRVTNWRTVVAILGSFALMAGILHHSQPDRFAPVLWHLCAGGLMFGAFFMATDPVTSPGTNTGKWLCGIAIGLLVALIRNYTGYTEGMMFALLFGNILSPIIDEVCIGIRLRRLRSEI
jgi:Na(+)-translocating NADH:ubiquinone oxidoreductase B subunit